jgi:head-tail adaptor
VEAGKLRFRLEVQAPAEYRDDIGGVQQIWQTVGTVWADIEPLRARELFEAQSIEARLSHRIMLRAYPGFEARWRLVWAEKQRAFQVYSVRDVHERHRITEALAMELIP